jgi:hypothetical protein
VRHFVDIVSTPVRGARGEPSDLHRDRRHPAAGRFGETNPDRWMP